jgi:FMN phosphatase YigB (HAD superfamily)/predicted ATP-grasp superfamily ATP-dependent carboligase
MKMLQKNQLTILFTCVGRRVELLEAFHSAAFDLGIDLTIIGTDTSSTVPTFSYCDKAFTVCRISNKEYIPTLKQIVQENHVDLVIPTIDTDLLILAEHRDVFISLGTDVLVSDKDKIQICRDKRLTYSFFAECGVSTPHTVDDAEDYQDGFPCFIKPKNGSSSINAYKVFSHSQLLEKTQVVPEYIIQPFIKGTEYTVDVFCDFSGNPIHITPRKRLLVRSGEVLVTEICNDEQIISECKQIIRLFKPRGPLTIQLIRDELGKDHYIEINPRFGGGAPLSMKSGANSALSLLTLLAKGSVDNSQKDKPSPNGKIYSRFDHSVAVRTFDPIPTISSFYEVLPKLKHMRVQGVILDLDDTLYPEKEYVKSGFSYLCDTEECMKGEFERLWRYFEKGVPPIDNLLKEKGLYSETLKKKLLTAYRYHVPVIHLFPGVLGFLREWKECNPQNKLGLITDGRVEGQNNKIDALGIRAEFNEIIITDELAGSHGDVRRFRKPNPLAFEIMRERLGIDYSQLVYIGDNLKKDFQAPSRLGMQVIQFIPEDGVYA